LKPRVQVPRTLCRWKSHHQCWLGFTFSGAWHLVHGFGLSGPVQKSPIAIIFREVGLHSHTLILWKIRRLLPVLAVAFLEHSLTGDEMRCGFRNRKGFFLTLVPCIDSRNSVIPAVFSPEILSPARLG
jgi:hypothetical protein